jgi:hypothetical protein
MWLFSTVSRRPEEKEGDIPLPLNVNQQYSDEKGRGEWGGRSLLFILVQPFTIA